MASQTKFKEKGDMLLSAAEYPGAWAAFFLSSIHERRHVGRITESKQLRSTPRAIWANNHALAALTGPWDRREVQA